MILVWIIVGGGGGWVSLGAGDWGEGRRGVGGGGGGQLFPAELVGSGGGRFEQ